MKTNIKDFDIVFVGLKLGEHEFDYQLDNQFFALFEYHDFLGANIQAKLVLDKKDSNLSWSIQLTGSVTVPCDITNEPFDLPIEAHMNLVVKFGDEFDDSLEEILILPSNEHRLNLAQYLYELAVLAVPLKRISEAGKAIDLEGIETEPEQEPKTKEDIDPRWQKLKDLLS